MLKISDIKNVQVGSEGQFSEGNIAAGIQPTVIPAQWLNSVQAELVNWLAYDGMAPHPTHDDQLAQWLSRYALYVKPAELSRVHAIPGVYLYPEILTPSGCLAIEWLNPQTLKITDHQHFLYLGINKIAVNEYPPRARTFGVDTQKTYHLIWQAETGFQLNSLDDTDYNPNHASDTSTQFDSDYHRLLIACIVVDEKGTPVVNLLKNKISLRQHWHPYTESNAATQPNTMYYRHDSVAMLPINWGRTPMVSLHGMAGIELSLNGLRAQSTTASQDWSFGAQSSRYIVSAYDSAKKGGDESIYYYHLRA